MAAETHRFVKLLHRLAQESTGFRKVSFTKAADILEQYDDVITVDEISKLPGIGKGILIRLNEFIKTGTLKELKCPEEKSDTLDLFLNIYGVGPITAAKLYNDGYRKLEDIPFKKLTKSQQLGVIYYDDINSRIPRDEINSFNKQLQQRILQYNKENKREVKVMICGSYLRGKKESGDIDIIVAERKDDIDVDKLLLFLYPLIEFILAKGKTKVLSLGGLGKRRRIDLELVKWENWAFALLYFTGSKNFNKCIRQIAKDKGYLLNQEGIFSGTTRYHMDTEKEIFEFLGAKYQTPAQRDQF